MSDTFYHFVPTVRQGFAASIDALPQATRAAIQVQLQAARRPLGATGWESGLDPIPRTIQLYGPGDITGFDARMIVRQEPKPGAVNFEPNYFPAVEFADPDFPWRFSPEPVAAGGSSLPADITVLTPWIALIALVAEDRGADIRREFDEIPRTGNARPAVRVLRQDSLPDLAAAWRWAHVQVTAGEGDLVAERIAAMSPAERAALQPGDIERLVGAEVARRMAERPELVVSRLLCARRLRPETLYRAFIVPTYRLGWAAGLDTEAAWNAVAGAAATDLAWDASSLDAISLPYYHSWEFRTSARGDFEFLVRLIEPRVLEGLGLRPLDCTRAGFGLRVDQPLDMEGALQSIDTQYTAWGKDGTNEPEPFQVQLASRVLNRATVRASAQVPAGFGAGVLDDFRHAVEPDGTSVRFVWRTAGATTGVLDYGPEAPGGSFAYTEHAPSDTPGQHHEVTVLLVPERRYHFRLRIEDGTEVATDDATISVPLPAVVPPIYGRWHAARPEVVADDAHDGWLDCLNLDPRHRAAAGLGAEVVGKQQEALMASAWDQIGAIEATNGVLRRAQFGRETSLVLHTRLDRLPLEDFLRVSRPVQSRVVRALDGGSRRTVRAELAERVPRAMGALSPAFRRLARPRGPIRRRQETRRTDLLRRLATGLNRVGDPDPVMVAGPPPTPVGTPRPCAITSRMYQNLVFDRMQVPNGTGSGGGVTPTGTGGDGGGVVVVPGSGGPATGPGPIVTSPAMIPVPASARRFCEDRISSGVLDGVGADGIVTEAVKDALDGYLAPGSPPAQPAVQAATYLGDLRMHLHDAIDPHVTIPARLKRRLILRGPLAARFDGTFTGDPLDEVIVYPEFPQPMYEPLRDIAPSLILPGVETVPQNTIGLCETNGRFVESYLVGLNHSFAGELLWRRYPTDQRGSYFRQMWDVSEYVPAPSEVAPDGSLTAAARESLKDIRPLHRWGQTLLGDNDNRRDLGKAENLVLIVRGDLLKRYPTALVYAIDAHVVPATDGYPERLMPRLAEFGDATATPIFPLFRGSLGADLVFLGFPFDETAARSERDGNGTVIRPGKFFVLQERPSEPRFGLDLADASVPAQNTPIVLGTWRDLHWGHFGLAEVDHAGRYLDGSSSVVTSAGETWNDRADAALRASVTLQRPARLAVHADDMLPAPAP